MNIDSNKLNYLYSLLPSLTHLRLAKKVIIQATSCISLPSNAISLGHANQVNTHLYKPVFYFFPDSTDIYCQVASLIVARHVRIALQTYAQYSGLNYSVIIRNDDSDVHTSTRHLYQAGANKLVQSLQMKGVVVFARLDSVVGFLRMMDIIFEFHLNPDRIQQLFIELELYRLKHNLLSVHQEPIYERFLGSKTKEALFSRIPLAPIGFGTFLKGQNVTIGKNTITVIDLPWGMDIAYLLGNAVLNAGAREIYLIGGVGCLASGVDVDDVFMATSVCKDPTVPITIKNDFLTTESTTASGLFTKKTTTGVLLSVNSSLDHPPNFSIWAKNNNIAGVDMEAAGLLKSAQEGDVKLCMIHYIMDLPLIGLGLGATYYNKRFLTQLFANANRGKYFCFETVFGRFTNWSSY